MEHPKRQKGPLVFQGEDRISPAFPAIDNDLAVENLTNDFDMTAADMQDLT